MKELVWPVATYCCESWTFRKNEETRLDTFEMKVLRKILRVSWRAKETNKWVLNKAGVKKELLDTVKARNLAYGPADATASCFSKIQIGFTFLVPAHLGSPGKRAAKWVCVCVLRWIARSL